MKEHWAIPLLVSILILGSFGLSQNAYAPSFAEQAKLTALDAAASDQFGKSVSISGDTAIVGVELDDGSTGSAYIFVRSGTTWTQEAKLTASDAASFDQFGTSVSISGDTVIVGARFDEVSTADSASGSAYVFTRSGTTWTEVAKLTASDAAKFDTFGSSVSISGDTAIVGSWGDDSLIGSAYVFVTPAAGWSGSLNEDAKLTASDATADDRFGFSVSISGDTAIVGAIRDDDGGTSSGSAYVFVKPAAGWSGSLNEDAKLTASDAAALDQFGFSVSISGDTAILSSPGDDDGGNGSGSAYVFVRSGTTWTQQAKLTASDAALSDRFGTSVSISGDTAIVGAW